MSDFEEYKPMDVEHNVKAAVENLRKAYWSNETEKVAKHFTEAEDKIISAICHLGYTVCKETTEGDCISREALKEQFKSLFDLKFFPVLQEKLLGIIDNAPPVETFTLEDMQNNYDAGVDSVIGKYDKAKGEWSQYSFHDLGAFGDWDYKCSKCNKVNGWKANFCPNCGADMRGGAE